MLSADGWFDWAVRDPGHESAVNGGRSPCRGVVPHSAEGNFATLKALHDFHWSRNLAPPGKRASWGATNLKDGRWVQHFSVYAQTWTSGAAYPNNNFFAFENEGKAGEPLTDAQVANIVRVIAELSAKFGWTPTRPRTAHDKEATLYEHRECVRWGAEATACPSGRIPWPRILAALTPEEEDMRSFLCWDSTNKRVMFVGPSGAVWIAQQTVADELAKTFGPMTVALSAGALKALGAP